MTDKEPSPRKSSSINHTIAIAAMAITGIITVIAGTWLAAVEKDVPDMLQILGAASIGSLGGYLSGGK